MAQLKSGSTVGGQTIATTAQTGVSTGTNDIGMSRIGMYRDNNTQTNYSYGRNYADTLSGSQLGTSNGFQSYDTYFNTPNNFFTYQNNGNYNPISAAQLASQTFQTGTWRALGKMQIQKFTGQDSPGRRLYAGALHIRVS